MDAPVVRQTAYRSHTTERGGVVDYERRMPDYGHERRTPDYGYERRTPDYGYERRTPDYGYTQHVQYRQMAPENGRLDHIEQQSGTLTRRLQQLNTALEDYDDPNDSMEPDLENTNHMTYVDGRCSCCPYGYHIDTDFLQYCDNLNDASSLQNLKKIKRNKRKLRKSMEIFLEDQRRVQESGQAANGPPPDVVNSHSEQFMRAVQAEDRATRKILHDIDSSVNATLTSIDSQIAEGRRSSARKVSEYDYDSDASLTSPSPVNMRGYSPFSPKSPGPPVPPKPSRKSMESPGGSTKKKKVPTATLR